ncbi:antibiotic biosynthesis monooxygenase family protein [Streptomyces antimicrobicus]|uniref:Antibiotic biosynthesis monooxygenase n=1 Tax=Streptomyces antimicrobicus TaxID=2883108 RepID=A0ABS8B1N2_9ACTN|nr:antibiotic biosynthesis monooxygenase [Streptomyces antimicrobicus]MCB5178503.1 antibiotic biosynthesis monooxygenase [Streptomyces antimicrobicus]
MDNETAFASIIEYEVDGPQTQAAFVAAFAELAERWVRSAPGFVSARFHAGTDGTRVHNVVTWRDEDAYRAFVETSDTEGRLAAIEAAVAGLPGTAVYRGTGAPTYRVVREVGPGPAAA